MKDAATASYSKKGDAIVKMNHDAIDAGAQQIVKVEVPESWKNAQSEDLSVKHDGEGKLIDYVNDVLVPINQFRGMQLPVSTFEAYQTGEVPLGSSAFEKRGIAIDVPVWNNETCIECGNCSYVCPHACIRPVILTKDLTMRLRVSDTKMQCSLTAITMLWLFQFMTVQVAEAVLMFAL